MVLYSILYLILLKNGVVALNKFKLTDFQFSGAGSPSLPNSHKRLFLLPNQQCQKH